MKDCFTEFNGNPFIVTFPDGYGSAMVNGRKWRWDYTKWGGPIFLNKDGSDRKRPPGPKHPVWKAFERWEKRVMRKEAKP